MTIRKARVVHNWLMGADFRKLVEDGVRNDGIAGETEIAAAIEERYMNLVRHKVSNADGSSSDPKVLSVSSVKTDFPNATLVDTLDQAYWRYQNLYGN
jgi:hypothetical protein